MNKILNDYPLAYFFFPYHVSAIEMIETNHKIKIDLLIILDTQDPKIFGIDNDNISSNVENVINYYQNTEIIGGEQIEINNPFMTNGGNILSIGSNHRSIDNDQRFNILNIVYDYISKGINPYSNAIKRNSSFPYDPNFTKSDYIKLPLNINKIESNVNKSQ